MYNFYLQPPKSKKDIREWLTSWLEKPEFSEFLFEFNNEKFVYELGFVRAFHIHSVLRSEKTNEYLWWVYDKNDEKNKMKTFPSNRFFSYEELLENVIEDYYTLWKLKD